MAPEAVPGDDPVARPRSFRSAGLDDVTAVVALADSAYRGDASRVGWTTEADLLGGQRTDAEAVTELITTPGSIVLVLEADGELVACCNLAVQADGAVHLGLFAVRPSAQGRGVGRAVVAEADRLAREWGASLIRMTVIGLRTDLLAWYARLGFEPTGETEPFPYGDERFGIPTRPDLEFVVLERPVP